MKKITLLALFAVLFSNVFAGGGWATSVVSLTKDGGSPYLYTLNNEGWTDGTWGSNTSFNAYDFGTPVSLTLNGGAGNAWAADGDYYNATSFVVFYRVYKVGDTPGTWSQIALDNQAYQNGNNCIYDKANAAIDILALATVNGTNTYNLEVVMSKNQFYTGGNWNSMIPSGQATAYSADNAGYKATFVKSITTDLQTSSLETKIFNQNNRIEACFNGMAHIELYSFSGQLIDRLLVENNYSKQLSSGAYILRINGESHKVIIK